MKFVGVVREDLHIEVGRAEDGETEEDNLLWWLKKKKKDKSVKYRTLLHINCSSLYCVCLFAWQIPWFGRSSLVYSRDLLAQVQDTVTLQWSTRAACTCLVAWKAWESREISGNGILPVPHGLYSKPSKFLGKKKKKRCECCHGSKMLSL